MMPDINSELILFYTGSPHSSQYHFIVHNIQRIIIAINSLYIYYIYKAEKKTDKQNILPQSSQADMAC